MDILIPKSTFQVSVTSDHVGAIYDSVAKMGGSTSGEEYGIDGHLSVTITCNLEVSDLLKTSLTDATRGTVKFLECNMDDT